MEPKTGNERELRGTFRGGSRPRNKLSLFLRLFINRLEGALVDQGGSSRRRIPLDVAMHTNIAIDDDLMPPPCGSAGAENQARRNAGHDEEIDVARKPR